MTATYIQMAGALAFVLLLILGAAYVMRKKQKRIDLMNVISYQNIGPKKGVAALKIGREVLLLGVSANDVRLLKAFRDDELDLGPSEGFRSKLEKFKRTETVN
jgi:flagellar biogenesis protein FliO